MQRASTPTVYGWSSSAPCATRRSRQSLRSTLEAALRAREVLLLLDNCEHLITACAELVEVVLRAGSGVRVLATSREALRLAGETVYLVPPLTVPAVTGSSSVQDVMSS